MNKFQDRENNHFFKKKIINIIVYVENSDTFSLLPLDACPSFWFRKKKKKRESDTLHLIQCNVP